MMESMRKCIIGLNIFCINIFVLIRVVNKMKEDKKEVKKERKSMKKSGKEEEIPFKSLIKEAIE